MEANIWKYGFETVRKKWVEEVQGEVYELNHKKSGAKVIVIDNQDNKKAFLVGFKTLPEDSTGVFHILEHSVLSGSEKYPEKDTFVKLLKHSMAEFVNAITFLDHTVYPFCTENEKDYMNLMDVYMNAVFYPRACENEEIFRQEGWHYQYVKERDAAEISGVVYNEMKGVYASLESRLINAVNCAMFPDTVYRHVSGGNPEEIPTLSYEKFVQTYRRFYRSGNCCIVLYGKMNVEEKLRFLNEDYLGKMEDNVQEISVRSQRAEVTARSCTYDVAASGNQGTLAAAAYHVGLHADKKRRMAVAVLMQALMGENDAPMKRELLEAAIAPDVSWYLMDDVLQPYLVFLVNHADAQGGGNLSKIIRKAVQKLCWDGIEKEMLYAALNQQEFWLREQPGGYPDGVNGAMKCFEGFMYQENIIENLEYAEIMNQLQKEVETGYFERLLEELILKNDYRADVIMTPQVPVKKREDSKNDGQIQQSKLKLSDVKEQEAETEPEVEREEHVKYLDHFLDTRGIIYLKYYLDIGGIKPEELPYAKLLTELLGNLATRQYTAGELNVRKKKNLGNMSFYLDGFAEEGQRDKARVKFVVDVSALERNLTWMVQLPWEILRDTLLDNEQEIQKRINQIKTDMEQMFVANGNQYAALRTLAHFSMEAMMQERCQGVLYYQFLCHLLQHYDEEYENLLNVMQRLLKYLCEKAPLLISYCGEKSKTGLMKELVKSVVSTRNREMEDGWYVDNLLSGKSEAFLIPSDVSYVAMGNRACYDGASILLARILSYDYLWKEVRELGGAYGCRVQVNPEGDQTMTSYRDPEVGQTCETFRNAANWLENLFLSDQELEAYKIAAIAAYDRKEKPYLTARQQDMNYSRKITASMRQEYRKQLLSVTMEELRQKAGMLREFTEKGYVCVFGNQNKIEESGVKFDVVSSLIAQ